MHKLGVSTIFNEKLYFFPDLNEIGEYRATFNLGTVTKLSKWLGWCFNGDLRPKTRLALYFARDQEAPISVCSPSIRQIKRLSMTPHAVYA